MLAESKCFEPLYTQYTPVTRSYTDTACTPFRPRSPFQMSADSWAASARRAAGPVHRPSVTVAAAADPAADAFAVAARDVATWAVRLTPSVPADAVAAPAELQATTPTISTADPAKSTARIPIAHRSISCAACRYRA
jgi:hypothetical protein